MKETLMLVTIVDAYNVIHRHPRLRQRAKKDMDGAREALIALVAGYAAGGKKRIVLVFDGRSGGETGGSPAVQLVYSDTGKTADRKIKDRIDASNNPRNLVVVSSDTEVYRYARLNGCATLSAEEFIDALSAGKARSPEEKPASVSEKEKEEWLMLFRKAKR